MGVRIPAKVLAVLAFVVVLLALGFAGLWFAAKIAGVLTSGVPSGQRPGSGDGRSLVEEGEGRSEQVAFASNWEGSPQLYVMDVSLGAWKRITAGSGDYSSPVFSPDGRRIAYSNGGDIYTIEASGCGEPERVVSTPSLDYVPAWSPDGRRIAYTCKDGEGADICVVDADGGGEPEKLTGSDTEDYDPTYSPDGGTIVYSGEREAGGETSGDLYAMRPNGSQKWRITETVPGARRFDAAFSPDGEVLAYVGDRRGDFEVFLMRPDDPGRHDNQVNLTNDEQDNFSPSFSTDGEKIIYTEDATTNIDLMVMDSDGLNKQRITDSPAIERQPNWKPEPGEGEDRPEGDGLQASAPGGLR